MYTPYLRIIISVPPAPPIPPPQLYQQHNNNTIAAIITNTRTILLKLTYTLRLGWPVDTSLLDYIRYWYTIILDVITNNTRELSWYICGIVWERWPVLSIHLEVIYIYQYCVTRCVVVRLLLLWHPIMTFGGIWIKIQIFPLKNAREKVVGKIVVIFVKWCIGFKCSRNNFSGWSCLI